MTTPAQPSSAQQVQDALAASQQPAQTDPTQQVQPEQQPPVVQQTATPESQALYADYLNELPETVRPLAESAFKKWDADVTRRFQELHSQYDPWKPVIDGANPDDVAGALQVAQVLEQDPERFLRAFAESFPDLVQGVLTPQQQQQQQAPAPTGEQGLGDLDPNDPLVQRISQLEQMLQQAVGGFQGFTEQQQQQENQKILDQTMQQLHNDHGDFDETYVLSQMAYRGLTPEQAVTEFKNNVIAKYGQPQQQQPQTPAPTVLTPGGGVPANPVDVAALSDKDTKALVAQLLDQANQQASGS